MKRKEFSGEDDGGNVSYSLPRCVEMSLIFMPLHRVNGTIGDI